MRLLILPILFFFSLSACQLSSLTSGLFEIDSGAVIYQDDFSNPSSGWVNLVDERYGTLDYFDGYYRVDVQGDHQMLWTGPGMNFNDVRMETDTIKVIGSPDDIFGLICRGIDQNNFYFFIISSDGYYGIGKMINGVQSIIDNPGMLPSETIAQGKAKNHLRADCIADRLEFYVNGQYLFGVTDSDLSSGDVGVIAGNLDSDQTVVLFDNFSVLNP
ncbi:MAG: hypothetical protein JSV42_03290 [Chloroflexota bacterium]|nr:MAG: hypothetical protein JSV42_03290 [Chloroflexota bacterium]